MFPHIVATAGNLRLPRTNRLQQLSILEQDMYLLRDLSAYNVTISKRYPRV